MSPGYHHPSVTRSPTQRDVKIVNTAHTGLVPGAQQQTGYGATHTYAHTIFTSLSKVSLVPPYSGTSTLSPTATDMGITSPSYIYTTSMTSPSNSQPPQLPWFCRRFPQQPPWPRSLSPAPSPVLPAHSLWSVHKKIYSCRHISYLRSMNVLYTYVQLRTKEQYTSASR